MREIFIQNNTLDELTIFKSSTSLCYDFDQIKVNILSFKIRNVENGLKSKVGIVGLALRYDLGSESGHGALSKVLVVVLGDVNFLLDLSKFLDSDVTSLFETISNLKWVNTFIQKFLGLLKDGTSEDNNTSCSITDFVVLRSGQLDKESGGLVMNFHLLQDGGTIIGDDDFTIWTDEHLVHTFWAEGCLEETGNGSCGQDVDLVGLESLDSLFLRLLPEDDEWST